MSTCQACAAGAYQTGLGGTLCRDCLACRAWQYRGAGCNATHDGACTNCTRCAAGAVTACANTSDAVCADPASACLDTRVLYPFLWIGPEQRCQAGRYLAGFDAGSGARDCRPCPAGWAGKNGMYCERCGPLEEPYELDRSSCVCKPPAVMDAGGACVCPDGSRLEGGVCVPCANNTRGLGGQCVACGAGNFSRAGATRCEACPYGQYRVGGQAACQNCTPANSGWFAPDPAQAACVRCNATCAGMPGWYREGACPGDDRYSVCRECPGGLPRNASWIPANATDCAFECQAGFYHAGGTCGPCNATRVCEAGSRLTACTAGADSHCDVPCEDPDKPSVYSHWEKGAGCPWACDAGYELRVWDYVMFQLRECARV